MQLSQLFVSTWTGIVSSNTFEHEHLSSFPHPSLYFNVWGMECSSHSRRLSDGCWLADFHLCASLFGRRGETGEGHGWWEDTIWRSRRRETMKAFMRWGYFVASPGPLNLFLLEHWSFTRTELQICSVECPPYILTRSAEIRYFQPFNAN